MKTCCLECDEDINIPDSVLVGEIITCPSCGMDFEIIKIQKGIVTLTKAEEIGEDWGE